MLSDYDLTETEATANADWNASQEIRAEFRGNRERYMAYRRAAAKGRIAGRISTSRRGEAVEAANAAARSGANIDSATLNLWSENAVVRQEFGNVTALSVHMRQVRAAG